MASKHRSCHTKVHIIKQKEVMLRLFISNAVIRVMNLGSQDALNGNIWKRYPVDS